MLAVVRWFLIAAGLVALAACSSTGGSAPPQAAASLVPPPGVTPVPTSSPISGPKANATISFTLPMTAQEAEARALAKVAPTGYFPPFTGAQAATSVDVVAPYSTIPFRQTFVLANVCSSGPPVTCSISAGIPVGTGVVQVAFYNDGPPRRILAGGSSASTTFVAGSNPNLTITSGRFASNITLTPAAATVGINVPAASTTTSYTLNLQDAFGNTITSGTTLSNPITASSGGTGTVGVGTCGATNSVAITTATSSTIAFCPNVIAGYSGTITAAAQNFAGTVAAPGSSMYINAPEHHIYSIALNASVGNVVTASSFGIASPAGWVAASPPSIAAPSSGDRLYVGSIFSASYSYFPISGITSTGGGTVGSSSSVSSTYAGASGTRVACQLGACVGFALTSGTQLKMEQLVGTSAFSFATFTAGSGSIGPYASGLYSGQAVGVANQGGLSYRAYQGDPSPTSSAASANVIAVDASGTTPYVAYASGSTVNVASLSGFPAGGTIATFTPSATPNALLADATRHLLFIGTATGSVDCYDMSNPASPTFKYSLTAALLGSSGAIVAMTSFAQYDLVYPATNGKLAVFQGSTGQVIRTMTGVIPFNPGIAAAY